MIPSFSENRGVEALCLEDKRIYSVGISTGGSAEIRMAALDAARRIVATTLDPVGVEFARQRIEEEGFTNQIEVKREDVSQPLPYVDGYFDFIYARLVLHYLSKADLQNALRELHRVLKRKGKLFVVVRSEEGPEPQEASSTKDEETQMTRYLHQGQWFQRHFHTEQSICSYLLAAGFTVAYAISYQEQLCSDFARTQSVAEPDVLIEVSALKSGFA